MAKEHLSNEEKKAAVRKQTRPEKAKQLGESIGSGSSLTSLQQKVGNQAVQRLITQRSGTGPTELDDETANRINHERSGGQPLDSTLQGQMSQVLGYDFSEVKVHTSSEADDLNQQLGAKAFTTGQDVFFREGAYEPHTGSGQELVAHELTHVVQQGSGQVHSGGRMTVNQPGDIHEQAADAVAKTVTRAGTEAQVQRQEEAIQQQEMPEEEEEIAE
jgi:hypothetical protein